MSKLVCFKRNDNACWGVTRVLNLGSGVAATLQKAWSSCLQDARKLCSNSSNTRSKTFSDFQTPKGVMIGGSPVYEYLNVLGLICVISFSSFRTWPTLVMFLLFWVHQLLMISEATFTFLSEFSNFRKLIHMEDISMIFNDNKNRELMFFPV